MENETNRVKVGELPERLVMALDMARAVQTPFPPPDISSPRRSFANRSFINSTSERKKTINGSREIINPNLWDQFFLIKHY